MGITTSSAAINFNPRPREGGDGKPHFTPAIERSFQSTPPREGGRRGCQGGGQIALVISIHAPREGGDHQRESTAVFRLISIHAPREGGDVGVVKLA